MAHGACDGTSRAFGGGTGAPVPASESDRSREFAHQDVTLDLALCRASHIAEGQCFGDVLVDLGQAAAISRLGARVQQLTRISVCRECDGVIFGVLPTVLFEERRD